MLAAFPKAWSQLIAEDDDMLLEIVADRVESLCGFKPGPDMVAAFLKGSMLNRLPPAVPPKGAGTYATRPVATPVVQTRPASSFPAMPKAASQRSTALQSGQTGFTFAGVFHPTRNAIDTLRQIFDLFVQNYPSFAERFAGLPRHGRTRRYLARDANDLYRDRPDLVRECSVKLDSGWWISTNHSKQTISQIIAIACDVAQVAYGKDLMINLD